MSRWPKIRWYPAASLRPSCPPSHPQASWMLHHHLSCTVQPPEISLILAALLHYATWLIQKLRSAIHPSWIHPSWMDGRAHILQCWRIESYKPLIDDVLMYGIDSWTILIPLTLPLLPTAILNWYLVGNLCLKSFKLMYHPLLGQNQNFKWIQLLALPHHWL